MTTTERPTLPASAQPYLAAVRSLLWALPADERDELLDDLSSHLAELAAEDGPSLRDRLGAPSAYAAEFVSSAGVDVSATTSGDARTWRELARLSPSMRERVAALRPAWLGLRPFLIVFGAAASLNDRWFGDVGAVEVVVLAAVATAFVGVSQRVTGTWDKLATLAGILAAFVVAGTLSTGREYIYVDSGGYAPPGVLTRGDGSPVSNIWVYDADGNPIDAYLYDQHGRPLDDVAGDGYDDRTGERLTTHVRVDDDGTPMPNLYPRPQSREGRYGVTRDEPPVIRRAPATTSTTTTTTTTTSTTVPAGPPSTP